MGGLWPAGIDGSTTDRYRARLGVGNGPSDLQNAALQQSTRGPLTGPQVY